jgi:outer membrane protein assembly factor BamB
MKILKKNTKNSLIALFVILIVMATSVLVDLPSANAHSPPWQIPTWAYVAPAPEVVGVGQQMSFVMFLTLVPPGALVGNGIMWQGYMLYITKPDGSNDTLGPFSTDSVGNTYTSYTPSQVGKYTVTFKFPGQVLTTTGTYANDTFLPSQNTATFIVQTDPIPQNPVYPLPSEYWTHPIEGQNENWYKIASNWLAGPQTVTPAGVQDDYFQKDGIAPNSAHIMWTKPIEDGGIVGGTGLNVEGNAFYSGTQYNPRFDNPIIMHGRLYYEVPYGNSAGGGGFKCVDLLTGEDKWFLNTTGVGAPSFGYYYAYEMYNQHGVVPEGWLFTNNFARAIGPRTGVPSTLNITNVPSGTEIMGPSGEHLRYTISNAGNTTAPNWRLTQWNSSNVFNTASSGNIPANCPLTPVRPGTTYWNGSLWVSSTERTQQGYASVTTPAYDWNASITGFGTGMSSPSVQAIMYGDLILGRNGTLSSTTNYQPYITYWAISLKPESRGQMMWKKNIEAPPNNMTLMSESAAEGVWIMTYKETMQWLGYDMYTGNLLWGPTPSEEEPFGYYSWTTGGMNTNSIAYGKYFSAGYSGCVYCYDLKNGTLLWKYMANATSSIFARHTTHIGAISDGKLYIGTHEHSANTPLIKDNKVRCINATNGEEIWTMSGWGAAYSFAVADGYIVYLNLYDHQIYCVGKGPSGTTVSASPKVSVNGDGVLIEGTVTDESPSSKAKGSAAVSDGSMADWMAYKFMQKPKPTNTVGVEVTLDVIDPNNNYIHIGRVTSDAAGQFKKLWVPDVPGEYTIIATFEGSESYWPSYAETAVGVEEVQSTPAPTAQPEASIADTYFVPAIAAIIVLLALVLVILAMLMLRKRP